MNQDQRAAFEAEMKLRHGAYSLEYENGWYRYSPTQRMWLIWKAALASPEVRALRKDAERLDWLQQNDGRFFSLLHITSIVGKGFSPANSNKWFLSLRDAIDAAMEKQK